FSFIQEMEGISFVESMRLLAPKAGVTLESFEKKDFSKRNRLLDILESATRYFEKHLESDPGKFFREYLSERGLSEETIKEWRIGYAPDSWDNLLIRLKELPRNERLHFNDQEIFSAGLSVRKEGVNHYYNRFRDRIMFPITDINGNVIAFTARVNPKIEHNEKVGGKYINSPQTELYDKSRVVFGLDKARRAIKDQDLAIVVEGQMDAIMAHQYGFKNVVATSGTAFTVEHARMIKRYSNNIAFFFDEDSAGLIARDRSRYETLRIPETNIFIMHLEGYKDPADCLKNNPSEFARAVKSKIPMMQSFINDLLKKYDPEDYIGNKKFIAECRDMIARLPEINDQHYWVRYLSEKAHIPEEEIRRQVINTKTPSNIEGFENKNFPIEAKPLDRQELMSELILALTLRVPNLISYLSSKLEPEFIKGNEKISFYKDLIIYYNKNGSFNYEDFRNFLVSQGEKQEQLLDLLILLGEKDFYSLNETEIKSEIVKSIVELKKYYYQERIKSIQRELSEAEKNGKTELVEQLMNDFKDFTDRLREVSTAAN
ncbi:MAG: toprim domain-containing protein, partial [Patescibacteria group bacterium]|nr:toprim domain-containing protein [Patescibacteria group bacterium]